MELKHPETPGGGFGYVSKFWILQKIFLEMASFKAGNKKTWDFPRGSNFETKPRLKKLGFPELVIHVAIF